MFSILTDTPANLPSDLLSKLDISVVPFSYFIGGSEHTCTDTIGFDGESFYSAMKAGEHVTTALINPGRYIEYMRPILERGEDLLYVCLSSGVSGSFASARTAAAELRVEFPEREIVLFDSLGASLGEGLLAVYAARFRAQGMSLKDTAKNLEELRERMYQVFTVEDLAYLRRSGRLSNISAVVGTVLNIKPLLKGNEEGKIVSFAKVRGRRKSIEAMAKRYEELALAPETQLIGIAHANCPDDARHLISLLNRNRPPLEILNVCYEPVTGSHVGPGTLALFFLSHSGARLE